MRIAIIVNRVGSGRIGLSQVLDREEKMAIGPYGMQLPNSDSDFTKSSKLKIDWAKFGFRVVLPSLSLVVLLFYFFIWGNLRLHDVNGTRMTATEYEEYLRQHEKWQAKWDSEAGVREKEREAEHKKWLDDIERSIARTENSPPLPPKNTKGNSLDSVDESLVVSISRKGFTATITVGNGWHFMPYQIRLQTAQDLWKKWALRVSPGDQDRARITIVDLNGNEVGGSRILGGSLIWVQKE